MKRSETKTSHPVRGQSVSRKLICEVSGSPEPVVTWYKEGRVVQDTSRHVVTREELGGHVVRHVLSITGVGDSDYGNYSCLASNSVSSDRLVVLSPSILLLFHLVSVIRAYIELHGRPDTPMFSDSGDGRYLSWSVASVATVDMYRVLLRQVTHR